MSTFTIVSENREALRELLHENETRANKAVGVFLLLMIIGGSLFFGISALSFSIVTFSLPYFVDAIAAVFCIIILVCAWRKKFDAPWIKHWLLAAFLVRCAIPLLTAPEYSLYLLPIPLFLSVRYFEKKLCLRIALWTLFLFIIDTFFLLFLDAQFPQVAAYHDWMLSGWWESISETIFAWALSPAVSIVLLAWYAVTIAKSSASLIENFSIKCTEVNEVGNELSMASEIQMSSLPAPLFTAPGGNFSLAANVLTAREVGGDFFDYYMLDDYRLAVLVADVSDKGVPAALFMMSAKKTLRCALECGIRLEDALALATRLVCEDNQSDMFFTLWVAVIDVRTGRGNFANAGHPLPYLKHGDGSINTIDNDPDLFIGNFPDFPPSVHSFQMVPGDTLVLFTDGVTDAESAKGTRFQEQGIVDVLQDAPEGAKSVMEAIISGARDFSQGMAQFDDMTVLALECLNVEEPHCSSICLPACTKSVGLFLDATEELAAVVDCPDSIRRNLELVIDEIAENISMYAYEDIAEEDLPELPEGELGIGRMQLDLEMGANYAALRFQDYGVPFDPLAKTDPDVDGEPEIGGLGIYLVKNCVNDIYYERVEDKNVLSTLVLWNV